MAIQTACQWRHVYSVKKEKTSTQRMAYIYLHVFVNMGVHVFEKIWVRWGFTSVMKN